MIETERLLIRSLNHDDGEFVLELLNDKGFIENIGDRQVRTLEQARKYISEGPWSHYKEPGFGQLLVIEKSTGDKMGLCGLLQRDYLDCPDIGFAFLPAFRAKGYAREASEGVIQLAKEHTLVPRLAGIVSPDNASSIGLLERLGMRFVRNMREDEIPSPTRLYEVTY